MPSAASSAQAVCPRDKRWGVILAGGDGTRLQKLTRLICGDHRPKQFCPLLGEDTLLEQARKRAAHSIPGDQILFSLSRKHREFYCAEPKILSSHRIVQPANKGTAPPILHALLSIDRLDSDAIVAILPSDHHYSDESVFTAALETAFTTAAQRTGSVVLVGAQPYGPEVEYGWIELGASARGCGYFPVRGFREKPSLPEAMDLLQKGCLWNTFVMVGRVGAFLEMIRTSLPGLCDAFHESPLWTGSEVLIQSCLYASIGAADFSHQVLTVQPQQLAALRLGRTDWNDLGHPERVISVLSKAGLEPWWLGDWHASKLAVELAAAGHSHQVVA